MMVMGSASLGTWQGESMDEERRRDAVRVVRERLDAGDELESVIATLRADGLTEIPCIRVIREALGVDLAEAKRLVMYSPAFADRREATEALQESLVGALREINEIEAPDQGGPARELGDFRAALAVTLRMIRREPGPQGLTALSVPTDGEIVREVRRLRELADQVDAERHSAATDPSQPSNDETAGSV
jgi:ribosomal protein L7/L12